METYHYIYPRVQVQKNYQEYENSINNYPSEYINYESNTIDDNYPNYQMKSFYANQNILNYNNNIYNVQTANITNNYQPENYLINSEQNINGITNNMNNNVNKTPTDTIKRKQNLVYISSVSQKNNRINKIKTLENKDKIIISNNINNQGKQPKDNIKPISDEPRIKLDDTIKNNSSIKINTEEKNNNEKNNNEKINYLKTSENHIYEYNPIKNKKRNMIKNMNRIKKNNNFITINDAFHNKNTRNSLYSKEAKFKTMNKSNNNLNKFKKSKVFFTNNFSTKKLKDKSESNFATLISQKKLKIFSSYKLIHAQSPKNSNNEIKKINPEKMHSINKPPLSMKTMKLKNSYKRLNTPNLISTFRKTSTKKLVDVKQSPKNQNKNNKVNNNTDRNKKIVIKIANSNINTSKNAKRKFISKINQNNKTINNNAYFKNRESNSNEKIMNFSSNKIKKIIPNDRIALYTLKNEDKVNNSDIIKNFLKNYHKFKNTNLIHLKVSINSDACIDEKVDEKKNSKMGKKNYENIEEKLNLNITRKKNDEENRRFLNETNPKLTKRRVFKSSGKDRFNNTGVIINKKKNIYNFKKKIHRKLSSLSFNKVPKDKLYMNNKSFKGFSSEKKLESIKKKYKFTPHYKESKKIIIEKNKADLSEFIGLNNLSSSIYLNTSTEAQNKLNLTEAFPKKELNIKIEEDFENNDSITNKNDNIKIAEKEDNKDENKDEDEEDLLNHKSFILDLNSIIPINEKQLKDTFNNQNKTKTNTRVKVKPKIGDIN